MRFERKYIIDNDKIELLKAYLLATNFERHFKDRLVSSIYYDSVNFLLFKLSLNGISQRNKLRIRFYDYDIENIIIENKSKKAEANLKKNEIYKNNNSLLINNTVNVFSDLKQLKDLTIPRFLNLHYEPVVYIEYMRSYFISRDKKLRITVDNFLSFARVSSSIKSSKISNKCRSNKTIIEFKNEFTDDDIFTLIEPILNRFSLKQSKFSKYFSAIQTLY